MDGLVIMLVDDNGDSMVMMIGITVTTITIKGTLLVTLIDLTATTVALVVAASISAASKRQQRRHTAYA